MALLTARLDKPAKDHTAFERGLVYNHLVHRNADKFRKANVAKGYDKKLTGQQLAAAKGNAWKAMKKLGF